MDAEKRELFVMSVEVRILAATLARLSARSIEERLNAHSPNAEISGLQYGILRTLSVQSYTLSELSRRFLLDPSTLVPVVDALESKGMVARGKDPDDRRRIPLSLTPEGESLIQRLPIVHEDDLLYQCLADMGKGKSHMLLRLLREVIRRMPDGEVMLEETQARLSAMQGKKQSYAGSCGHPSGDPSNEHRRPFIRRIRRRYNRRRTQE